MESDAKVVSSKSGTKKWIIIAAIAAAALVIGGAASFIVYSNSPSVKFKHAMSLGEQYLNEMSFENAILVYKDAIAINPNDINAYEGLAEAYIGLGQIEDAIAVLETAEEINKDDFPTEDIEKLVGLYMDRAKECIDSGDYSKAEDYCNKAIELGGLNDGIKDTVCEVYLKNAEKALENSDYSSAENYYNKVLGYDSNNAEAKKGLCTVYIAYAVEAENNSDYDKAENYFKKVLEYDSNNAEAMDGLARIEEKRRLAEYEDSLRQMAKKIVDDPAKYDFSDAAILSEDYLNAVAQLSSPLFFYDEEDMYIGVYPSGYIYYGQMKDGMRSGKGYWYYGTVYAIEMDTCTWENDLPNGEATIDVYQNEAYINKQPGHTYALHDHIALNLINGVYDGDVNRVWEMDNGETHDWDMRYENGVPLTDDRGIAAYCKICGASLGAPKSIHVLGGLPLSVLDPYLN